MAFVYILRCVDGTLYVGATNDVPKRLKQHQAGTASAYTASRRPVEIVFTEEHNTRPLALAREAEIKRWTRAKKLTLID